MASFNKVLLMGNLTRDPQLSYTPSQTAVVDFVSKGKPIFLEGRLTYDSWTAQDGTKKSRLRITIENFQFLPGTGGGGGGPDHADQSYGGDQSASPARSYGQAGDDEIPF